MQTIDLLSFLTGNWHQGESFDLLFSEAKCGTLLGTLRQCESGSTRYFEFLHFMETSSGLVLHSYPRGQHVGPCPYVTTELDGRRVVFDNPAQPEFRCIWFERDLAGRTLRMGTKGVKDGRPHELHVGLHALLIVTEPHDSCFY